MRIIAETSAPAPGDLRGASLALGNFDGVHRGHQQVIAAALAAARAAGRPAGAAVFRPHPRRFFQPDAPPFRLQSAGQRARTLERMGLDALFEISFDAELAALTDAQFVHAVLAERLGAAHVAVGCDFTFGRGRMGGAKSLQRLGAEAGVTVEAIDIVGGAQKISSSTIREAISEGRMAAAAELLGRPWAIEGVVLAGDARGRAIGFPTLNLSLGAYQRPRFGVYAVRVDVGEDAPRPGVANIGVRPTFTRGAQPLLEAHLFDFSRDLYGRTIEVALIKFLRDEKKFDGLDALKAQIAQDAADASKALDEA
jgi:riboflavin kinase / FMN adenylyltransferase